jgi:hypothetical protein
VDWSQVEVKRWDVSLLPLYLEWKKNVYIFWDVIKIHCGMKLIKMKKGFPHFCIPSFVGTIMLKGGEWRWKQLLNISQTCKRIVVEYNFNTQKQHDIWMQKSMLHLSFGAMRYATLAPTLQVIHVHCSTTSQLWFQLHLWLLVIIQQR